MINVTLIFDVFVLVLLIYGVISGLFRGLFKEIGSIAGLVLGFLLTFKFGDNVASALKNQSALAPYSEYVTVVTYVVMFLVILVLVNMLTSFLLFFVFKARNIKIINRVGGAVLGFIKGWAVALIIYFLLISFIPFVERYVSEGQAAPYLDKTAKKMQVVVSDVLKNRSFRDVLFPPVPEVPPAPTPLYDENATNIPEQPMYIPSEEEELLLIESFE